MPGIDLQTQSISDFSGGMITAWNYRLYARNQVNRIINSNLSIDGAITTRKGRSKLLNDPIVSDSPNVRYLTTIGQISDADKVLAAVGSKIFEVSTGSPILLRDSLSVTAQWSSVMLRNYQFWVDGVDRPFMTQGVSPATYNVGIIAPVSMTGMTGAAVAGGTVSTIGSHRFTFRYRSSITGARSNPPISGNAVQFSFITIAAGQQYSVTAGAGALSSDAQVDLIDVFIQEAGAGLNAPYFYLSSMANTAGSGFTIDVSDDTLIIRERIDIDDNPAPNSLRGIEEWRERLLAISDDYHVRYSKVRIDPNGIVDLPTSWPETNELEVGVGDGDPLVRIMRFNDYVFAFKRRSVWLLLGDFGVAGFGFRRLKTNYTNVGLLNQYSIAQAGDQCYFVSDDLKFHAFGITDFSTSELRLAEPPLSDAIADFFNTFASQFRENIRVVNFTFSQFNQIWIAFNNGTGISESYNYFVLVYDYYSNGGKGAWHFHTGHEVASTVLARDQNRNYYVYSGDYYGLIWKHDEVLGDGAVINGTSSGANTTTAFNDVTKNFIQSPSLIGCFLKTIAGTGAGQTRRIVAVPSATQLTVAPAFSTTPDNTTQYTVGGFEWRVWSRFDWCNDEKPPDFLKHGWYLDFDVEAEGQALSDGAGGYQFQLEIEIFKERSFQSAAFYTKTFQALGPIWGVGIWGLDIWGDIPKTLVTAGMNIYFRQIWFKIGSQLAGQYFKLDGWTITYQMLDQLRRP